MNCNQMSGSMAYGYSEYGNLFCWSFHVLHLSTGRFCVIELAMNKELSMEKFDREVIVAFYEREIP